MKTSTAFVAATAAPLAAALQTAQNGHAVVINQCDKDFPYQYVPAMADGYVNAEISSGTIKGNGGKFQTPWVSLSKGVLGGWAIKIAPEDDWSNIFQYEYTWHAEGDDVIWFDMSFVNGKEPTLPKWGFDCPPRIKCHNRGYQYPADDTAMQVPAMPTEAVTLVLCPGNTAAPTPSAPASYPPSSKAPEPTTAPAPSTTLKTYKSSKTEEASISLPVKQANKVTTPAATSEVAPSPTEDVEIVTKYETVIATAVVTETAVAYAKHKRHEHRHPHGHHL